MVLLLLLVLALLLWSIQAELEPGASEIDIKRHCPSCKKRVDSEEMICKHCRQQLLEPCSRCHKVKSVEYTYCPYCGAEKGE